MVGDRHFSRAQRERLEVLMNSWRVARDTGKSFSEADLLELQGLVDAELAGATERSREMLEEGNTKPEQ
jgi:hypothetical protein